MRLHYTLEFSQHIYASTENSQVKKYFFEMINSIKFKIPVTI